MLFNLPLASITFLLCLFLTSFNSCFTIPVVIENSRLQLVLIIPTGDPITVANDAIEMQLLQIKQLMTYQYSQKKRYIY